MNSGEIVDSFLSAGNEEAFGLIGMRPRGMGIGAGGEGGIRSDGRQEPSASCRFYIPWNAKNATNHVPRCPILPEVKFSASGRCAAYEGQFMLGTMMFGTPRGHLPPRFARHSTMRKSLDQIFRAGPPFNGRRLRKLLRWTNLKFWNFRAGGAPVLAPARNLPGALSAVLEMGSSDQNEGG
jgi:hypothetical protein